jgi:16S rRNA (adenine1518-N6/adenine1519-N6)-dimethyltransferase
VLAKPSEGLVSCCWYRYLVYLMTQINLIKSLGPKKKLGQNFLIDEALIERELSYCDAKGKKVLEIGPGLGALTMGLALKASLLTAIEIDERFALMLKEKLRDSKNTTILNEDFLVFESKESFDLVVSNIPYYIASKILIKISELDFKTAIICIQKELADRMIAKPSSRDYSRLSVMSQLLFEMEFLERVPQNAFYPQPQVKSAILRLKKKGTVSKDLSHFINAVFQHRNKKLRNAIIDSREMLGLSKEKANELSSALSLHDRRVITLTKEEVVSSFQEFQELSRRL